MLQLMETDTSPHEQPAADMEKEKGQSSAHDVPVQQLTVQQLSLRTTLLTGAFYKVIQYGLQDPSREEFGECFPSMDADVVNAMYDAFKQALVLVRSNCQEEYQLICSEQQVAERLQALDQLEQLQQQAAPGATPLGGVRAVPGTRTPGTLTPGARTPGMRTPGRRTPSRDASTAAPASRAPSESVVREAEGAARRYALQQEAAHLQDLLDKARRTENRLVLALAMRQETVEKLASTYQQAVSDVKQVYDTTRAWPSAPLLKGTSD